MKKVYAKPEIMFESFSMSTNIAAGCEFKTSNPSYEQSCTYPTRGGNIFITKELGCGVQSDPEGLYTSGNDKMCYHVPDEDFNVFNS